MRDTDHNTGYTNFLLDNLSYGNREYIPFYATGVITDTQDTPSRHRAGRLAIHPDGRSLQSCAHPQATCDLIDARTPSEVRKTPPKRLNEG